MKPTTTTKQLPLGTLIRRGEEHLLVTAVGDASPQQRKDFGARTTYTLWSGRQNKFFTLLVGPRHNYFLPSQQ